MSQSVLASLAADDNVNEHLRTLAGLAIKTYQLTRRGLSRRSALKSLTDDPTGKTFSAWLRECREAVDFEMAGVDAGYCNPSHRRLCRELYGMFYSKSSGSGVSGDMVPEYDLDDDDDDDDDES